MKNRYLTELRKELQTVENKIGNDFQSCEIDFYVVRGIKIAIKIAERLELK